MDTRIRMLALAGALLLSASAAGGEVLVAPRPVEKLSWDDTAKVFRSDEEQSSVRFEFVATNSTRSAIVVESVSASCGCTTTDLPALPWTLAPGESGVIRASVDVTDKSDFVEKTLLVETSAGPEVLTMQMFLPPEMDPAERRARNQRIAATDRQKIFHPDCARCHVPRLEPAATGQELFQSLCAICHEARHRASMVPDLATSPVVRDRAALIKLITEGRERTLMPAFATVRGGVLSGEQIRRVADYAMQR